MHLEKPPSSIDKDALTEKLETLKTLAEKSTHTFKDNLDTLTELLENVKTTQEKLNNETLKKITDMMVILKTNDDDKKKSIREVIDLATEKNDLYSILYNGLQKLKVHTTSSSIFLSTKSKGESDTTNKHIIDELLKEIEEHKEELHSLPFQQYLINSLLKLTPNSTEKKKIIYNLIIKAQETIIMHGKPIKSEDPLNGAEMKSDLERLIGTNLHQKNTKVTINEQTITTLNELQEATTEMLSLPKGSTLDTSQVMQQLYKNSKSVDLFRLLLDDTGMIASDQVPLNNVNGTTDAQTSYTLQKNPDNDRLINITFTANVFLSTIGGFHMKFFEAKKDDITLMEMKILPERDRKINYNCKITATYDTNTQTLTIKNATFTKSPEHSHKIMVIHKDWKKELEGSSSNDNSNNNSSTSNTITSTSNGPM